MTNIPLVAFAAASVAVVGIAAVKTVKTTRIEREKRRQIQINRDRDLMAIRTASTLVAARLVDKQYSTMQDTLDDLNNEIQIQKMEIRFHD